MKESLKELSQRMHQDAFEEMTIEDAQAENIWAALRANKNYSGISLENIAAIFGEIYSKAELKQFIKELKLCINQKK